MISFPGRIPIHIYPFFWILAILIGWLNSMTVLGTVVWTVVILLSVLIHEFGHALTALAFGQNAYIELVGMGGVTRRSGKILKLWQEFIIVFNGPLAGFLLFLAAYYFQKTLGSTAAPVLIYAVDITIYANLFWTFINLLPVQPLDGGRLVSIILESLFGLKGLKVSLFLSILVSAGVAILFFAFQALLAGSLFLFLTFESYREWKNSLTIINEDRDDYLNKLLKDAQEDIQYGRQTEAMKKLQMLRDSSKVGVIYINASQEMAGLLNQQGKFKEAYNILSPLRKKISPEWFRVLHQLAYLTGNFKEALVLGGEAYQLFPSYDTALINSISYALNNEAYPSVGWLECAVRDGLPHLHVVLDKREFDSIRQTPPFQEFIIKYKSD
jgi:stage IV sporulation protein FB